MDKLDRLWLEMSEDNAKESEQIKMSEMRMQQGIHHLSVEKQWIDYQRWKKENEQNG